MIPTLTKREQERIAQCRQNHSGQVGFFLDIIDRFTSAAEVAKQNIRAIEVANQAADVANNAAKRSAEKFAGVLPDCMMPDGAEPCKGYQELHDAMRAMKKKP